MHPHEKVKRMRKLKGLTQEEMAEKLHMSVTGYAKIERGQTQLKIPRLEQIVAALEMELKDFLEIDEKTVFNASFYYQSCHKSQNNYVNSDKDMVQELEISRVLSQLSSLVTYSVVVVAVIVVVVVAVKKASKSLLPQSINKPRRLLYKCPSSLLGCPVLF